MLSDHGRLLRLEVDGHLTHALFPLVRGVEPTDDVFLRKAHSRARGRVPADNQNAACDEGSRLKQLPGSRRLRVDMENLKMFVMLST